MLLQHPRYVDPLNITAMACPAMPLCPLAITEAERGIPDILKRVRAVFEKVYKMGNHNYRCGSALPWGGGTLIISKWLLIFFFTY